MKCPVCDSLLDLDEDDVSDGDTLACEECGSELQVVSTDPIELEAVEDEEDEEDVDFDDEDEEEEEEDEDDEDWR